MEMDQATAAFAALAQTTRLRAFRLLVQSGPGGLAAGDLAERLGTPHNTLSTHLGLLARAGLITSERSGRSVRYALDIDGTRKLVNFLVADCCGGHPEVCKPIADAIAATECC